MQFPGIILKVHRKPEKNPCVIYNITQSIFGMQVHMTNCLESTHMYNLGFVGNWTYRIQNIYNHQQKVEYHVKGQVLLNWFT